MKFISARYVTSPVPPHDKLLLAMGDDGVEYTVSGIDSDVPPWPQFLAAGGTVEPENTEEE
jgi:hypothetical protein